MTNLLASYQPLLRFDSRERFFPVSVADWVGVQATRLLRSTGEVISSDLSKTPLQIGALNRDVYPNGLDVRNTDVLAYPHGIARKVKHQNSRLQDHHKSVVYGRQASDRHGRIWLQYWWFYAYNEFGLVKDWIRAGDHEGDWEMAQIRLDTESKPDIVMYTQHRVAGVRTWKNVQKDRQTGRPILFVANGSHAGYFQRGPHWNGFYREPANGRGQQLDQELVVVDQSNPEFRWLEWPGHWGGTKARNRILIDADSPRGPAMRGHWNDPQELLDQSQAYTTNGLHKIDYRA